MIELKRSVVEMLWKTKTETAVPFPSGFSLKKPGDRCLLVCIVCDAVSARGILLTCRPKPTIEVVISSFSCYVRQIEMEWKPRPLCQPGFGVSFFYSLCDREKQWEQWVRSGNSTESQRTMIKVRTVSTLEMENYCRSQNIIISSIFK